MVDDWDAQRWAEALQPELIVLTPQILLNVLQRGYAPFKAIGLLIVDECHHAVGRHPYAVILKERYASMGPGERPAVLGLTASAARHAARAATARPRRPSPAPRTTLCATF